jgi:hypothetical protein
MNYRTGSTRNEKIYTYFNKPSSTSAWHAHMAEELKRELATSIIASSRIGQANPGLRASQLECCRGRHAPS